MAMEYTVRVSDEVLESMALAAIEAYCLGDGRDDPGSKIETLGMYGATEELLTILQLYSSQKYRLAFLQREITIPLRPIQRPQL